MTALNCCFVTFNCGRTLLNASYFTDNLFSALKQHGTRPDLIILALEEIAPLSYSFLGGSFLAPYFSRFEDVVDDLAARWDQGSTRYERLLVSNVGLTALMLFAQPDVAMNVSGLSTAGVGVGDYELGNKGAVAVRLRYRQGGEEEMEMTFVSSHLAPMEDACERRNKDWRAINEDVVFLGGAGGATTGSRGSSTDEESERLLSSATDGATHDRQSTHEGLYSASSHLFIAGDLNYRTSDLPPHPDDHQNWPEPCTSSSDISRYSILFQNDQLTRELKANRTLHDLHEAPITFPPTYKYSSRAQEVAARKASSNTSTSDESYPWATHRTPSWCDRILYLKPPFPGTQPTILTYTSLPLTPTSDHQPVLLHFSVPVKALPQQKAGEQDWIKPPFAIKPGWQARRAAARRRELAVGIAAYLATTWEGEALLLGTVLGALGGWAMLRSLLVY